MTVVHVKNLKTGRSAYTSTGTDRKGVDRAIEDLKRRLTGL